MTKRTFIYKDDKTADFGLEDIFLQIQEDEQFKKDIQIHPKYLNVNAETGLIEFNSILDGLQSFDLNAWSKSQWCSKMQRIEEDEEGKQSLKVAGLTPAYWDSCPPAMKAMNSNHWLAETVKYLNSKLENRKTEPKEDLGEWLFRVREGGQDSQGNDLGHSIRGIMSKHYTKFDDIKLVEMLMTILEEKNEEFSNLKIADYQRNDYGFHIKLLMKDPVNLNKTYGHSARKAVSAPDDIHFRGIMIENSEVGRKAIRIRPFIWRQVCTNGLIAYDFKKDQEVFSQRHIGKTEIETQIAVAEAMGKALEATDDIIQKLKVAKETKAFENKKARELIERFSKECKYNKEFIEMVKKPFEPQKDETGKEIEGKTNAFEIVQAFTESVQRFTAYQNIDDRIRVEQDAVKLLNRLTA